GKGDGMTPAKVRADGRAPNEMRPVIITPNFTKHAEGSVLIDVGDTRVICTASVQEKVPPFMYKTGRGWVTAEYGMLPRATADRRLGRRGFGRQDRRLADTRPQLRRGFKSRRRHERGRNRQGPLHRAAGDWRVCDVQRGRHERDAGTRKERHRCAHRKATRGS